MIYKNEGKRKWYEFEKKDKKCVDMKISDLVIYTSARKKREPWQQNNVNNEASLKQNIKELRIRFAIKMQITAKAVQFFIESLILAQDKRWRRA